MNHAAHAEAGDVDEEAKVTHFRDEGIVEFGGVTVELRLEVGVEFDVATVALGIGGATAGGASGGTSTTAAMVLLVLGLLLGLLVLLPKSSWWKWLVAGGLAQVAARVAAGCSRGSTPSSGSRSAG